MNLFLFIQDPFISPVNVILKKMWSFKSKKFITLGNSQEYIVYTFLWFGRLDIEDYLTIV